MFDSNVPVDGAEAAYFDAEAFQAAESEMDAALNARLPEPKRLEATDLASRGLLVLYRADLRHHYVFVRGGNK